MTLYHWRVEMIKDDGTIEIPEGAIILGMREVLTYDKKVLHVVDYLESVSEPDRR